MSQRSRSRADAGRSFVAYRATRVARAGERDRSSGVPSQPVRTLEQAETRVGCPLSDALRALLLETDGLTDEYGLEVVFSAERLAAENLMMRSNADFPAL